MCMPVCYQINLRFLDTVNHFSLVCCKTLDIDVDKESFCQLLSKHQSGGKRSNSNKTATASCILGNSCSEFT